MDSLCVQLQGLAYPPDETARKTLADYVHVNHLADGLNFTVKHTSKERFDHDAHIIMVCSRSHPWAWRDHVSNEIVWLCFESFRFELK